MPKIHNEDGTYNSHEELQELYTEAGLDDGESTVTYCRLGERSLIEWFVLQEFLTFEEVQNYEGSWTK